MIWVLNGTLLGSSAVPGNAPAVTTTDSTAMSPGAACAADAYASESSGITTTRRIIMMARISTDQNDNTGRARVPLPERVLPAPTGRREDHNIWRSAAWMRVQVPQAGGGGVGPVWTRSTFQPLAHSRLITLLGPARCAAPTVTR